MSYIYSDFDIRILKDNNNDVKKIEDSESIENSIRNILMTQKGERLFNPEFGSNLRYYLYEPITVLTAEEIKDDLTINVRKYEDRISDFQVEVLPVEDENKYIVNVTYIEKLTEEQKELTFELDVNR